MKPTLAKAYEPSAFENKWYRYWEQNRLFGADSEREGPRFSIVMPPPNITGNLHIGHALDLTLPDILVRYQRMLGKNTLWLPGTDHASIATHARIEEALAEEGTTRRELGREAFLDRAWEWKKKYGGIIADQIKTMGASCDWSRERFTMDEGCSVAVTEIFVRLYEKGLIYKGDYMVNFCPRCHTVISDIEVDHDETDGHLWYVRYPIEGSDEYVEVATTRPETIPGDTAVAVNPKDPRYAHLVGKHAVLPVLGRRLPIIADDHVNPEFGTGAVKVTPAHDPDDFEMGKAHNLDFVGVINTYGKMTAEAGKYQGLDRYECRAALLGDFEKLGLLVKAEPYKLTAGSCSRCSSSVEPLISKQWFVKMKPLAEPALEAVRGGKVTFVPQRFTKVYENWMENVRDWCISRQLWWGHRIPAWYCQECDEIVVSRSAPDACPSCGGAMTQDEDVLDTWFSSGIWPFSTMGWPEDTADLRRFFPTDVLTTGYDIIFFWVARMIFLSLEFTGKEPFRHAVIHGMVRDEQGRKMSKSLGNGIDPLEVVAKFGADALRISLTTGISMGNDLRLYDEKVAGARNFVNKLWNAARYCLINLEGWVPPSDPRARAPRTVAGRWILSRLENTIESVRGALDQFEPGDAIDRLIGFIWNDFCDWYIEISKYDLTREDTGDEARTVLWTVLKDSLTLLHPFAPFVTEELWSHLPGVEDGPEHRLVVADYPALGSYSLDLAAEEEMASLIHAITVIRNIRAEVGIPTGKKAQVIVAADIPEAWDARRPYIERLAWADKVDVVNRKESKQTVEGEAPSYAQQSLTGVVKDAEIYLPLQGLIDVAKEVSRLKAVVAEIEKDLERTGKRLSDRAFLDKAPQEIIALQRKRFAESKDKIEAVLARISVLENLTK